MTQDAANGVGDQKEAYLGHWKGKAREGSVLARCWGHNWVGFVTCGSLQVSQGPVPCAEALNITTKAACASRMLPVWSRLCHNCWGTKAARQDLALQAVQQQNPHCFSRAGFLLLLGFYCDLFKYQQNTKCPQIIPYTGKSMGGMECVDAFPLLFPFVFTYFPSSGTLL